MKKILLLLIGIILLTGCSNINRIDIDTLIDDVMPAKSSKTNTALKGYKMYLSKDMSLVRDINNNNVITSFTNKYYLYVDLISYYNKNVNDYKINEENKAFYCKILNYNDKNGYVLVTKYENSYLVEVMYNYAKIEVITTNYKESITKSLMILKSITYNDKIIETLIGSNILEYDEEKYDLLGPKNETTDFLEYNYEDVDNELKDLDENIIDINETE